MIGTTQQPTWEEFRAAPVTAVARVAPATVLYVPAGTRRAAALAGAPTTGSGYAHWARAGLLNCVDLLFRYGVQHVYTLLITPSQFEEVGMYRAHLLDWVAQGFASEVALAHFVARGWRVRLLGTDSLPALAPAAARLQAGTPAASPHTLWAAVVPDPEAPWRELLAAAQRAGQPDRAAVGLALYGEIIPPATLLLSFGKPIITPDLVPPLLAGSVQGYWSQRPGYSLDELSWRRILYDYAYLRPTWRPDKTGRAEQARLHPAVWQRGPILGLGQRLGPFWYPTVSPLPREAAQPPRAAPSWGVRPPGGRRARARRPPDSWWQRRIATLPPSARRCGTIIAWVRQAVAWAGRGRWRSGWLRAAAAHKENPTRPTT